MGLIVFQDGYICKSESDLENKWGRKLTTTITSASISTSTSKWTTKKGKCQQITFCCFCVSSNQHRFKWG